jgi:putative FmdB family regulatory protein
MPTYDFRCGACGRSCEELVFSWSEADDVVCPDCGSPHVIRKVSAPVAIGVAQSSGGGSSCAAGGG